VSQIIFATSGSGKSHFARVATAPTGIPVVDGDAVISAHDLWPKAKFWWKEPGADDVHLRHAELIAKTLVTNPDIIVVWWTRLRIVRPVLDKLKIPMAGVQITEAELRRNWESRETAIKEGLSGHSSRSWEDYKKGWIKAESELEGLRVYDSFQQCAKAMKIYISNRANM